jgi:hypothetical protein
MVFPPIEDVKFDYEKVVIGSSIEALLYCYYNNVPFVCAKMESPDRFSYFDYEFDLSIFQLDNSTTILTTFPPTDESRGTPKSVLWEHLYFCLSLAGLNPLADKVSSIRIEDNRIRVFTYKARSATINANKVIVFNPTGISGMPSPKIIPEKKYKVYDWINVRSGLKHKYDLIQDPDADFVQKIFFYPTDRIDGDQIYKDACAVSYMTEAQLTDPDNSDINARFKVRYMMRLAGLRGPKNGYDSKDPTKQKYRPLRIESSHREIQLLTPPIHESTDFIEFKSDTIDDIMKDQVKDSYVKQLYRRTHSQY